LFRISCLGFRISPIRYTLYAIKNMQNKPNLRKAKMKLNSYIANGYERKPPLRTQEKQTQSNPTCSELVKPIVNPKTPIFSCCFYQQAGSNKNPLITLSFAHTLVHNRQMALHTLPRHTARSTCRRLLFFQPAKRHLCGRFFAIDSDKLLWR